MGGGTVLEFARSSTLSATSRALVEQAAAASQSLQAQSKRLAEAVGVFRVVATA